MHSQQYYFESYPLKPHIIRLNDNPIGVDKVYTQGVPFDHILKVFRFMIGDVSKCVSQGCLTCPISLNIKCNELIWY